MIVPLVAIFLFTHTAITLGRTVRSGEALFAEFGAGSPGLIAWTLWLYPLPPVAALLPLPITAFLLFHIPLAALAYLPGILAARQARRQFEIAGTDRVDRVQKACDTAVAAGIGGVLYVLVVCGLGWVIYSTGA